MISRRPGFRGCNVDFYNTSELSSLRFRWGCSASGCLTSVGTSGVSDLDFGDLGFLRHFDAWGTGSSEAASLRLRRSGLRGLLWHFGAWGTGSSEAASLRYGDLGLGTSAALSELTSSVSAICAALRGWRCSVSVVFGAVTLLELS